MDRQYKVADRVLVSVKGFEPWPATIDNVVLEESKKIASYHVRLDGSYKCVPINARCLKPLKSVDEKKWLSMCVDERWHEARKRNEVVEGVYIDLDEDGEVPSTLWNFVSADNNFEIVPDIDKANLKLSRVAHNAKVRYSELETKFSLHTLQSKMIWAKVKKDDRADVVDDSRRSSGGESAGAKSVPVIRFRCPMCSKKYKTRMALKKHMEYNADCNESKIRPSKPTEPPPPHQCPKCYALYKNEDMLVKHMAVHDKTLAKKKNGIRDYIRQAMANRSSRMASYQTAVKNKPTPNGKTVSRVPDPKRMKQVSSPEDSAEDDESDDGNVSDEEDRKNCRLCRSKQCSCSNKSGLRNNEVHNEKEKKRRFEMRMEFESLGQLLGVNKTEPKYAILNLAKDQIQYLEEKERKLERTLNDLRDMNIRLVSREYQLNMMKDRNG